MRSEERAQKFYTDEVSLYPDLGSASDWSYREGNLLQTIIGTPDPRSQICVASDASSVSQATEKAAVRKSVCVYTFTRLEIMRLTSKGFLP